VPKNRKLQDIMDGRLVRAMDDGEDFGFIPVMLRVDTTGGATATTSLTMERKFTVIDAHAILKADGGNNSNKVELLNASTTITGDMIVGTAGDKDIVRASEIDDAQMEIAAGGTLGVKVTAAASDLPALVVYVLGYYHL
jgi:hypothetical protein